MTKFGEIKGPKEFPDGFIVCMRSLHSSDEDGIVTCHKGHEYRIIVRNNALFVGTEQLLLNVGETSSRAAVSAMRIGLDIEVYNKQVGQIKAALNIASLMKDILKPLDYKDIVLDISSGQINDGGHKILMSTGVELYVGDEHYQIGAKVMKMPSFDVPVVATAVLDNNNKFISMDKAFDLDLGKLILLITEMACVAMFGKDLGELKEANAIKYSYMNEND